MDSVLLQQDLDFITRWSIQSSLKFNTSKSLHLSFKSKVTTTFKLLDVPVVTNTTHKDLGIILSVDLSWDYLYMNILQVKLIECLDFFTVPLSSL